MYVVELGSHACGYVVRTRGIDAVQVDRLGQHTGKRGIKQEGRQAVRQQLSQASRRYTSNDVWFWTQKRILGAPMISIVPKLRVAAPGDGRPFSAFGGGGQYAYQLLQVLLSDNLREGFEAAISR